GEPGVGREFRIERQTGRSGRRRKRGRGGEGRKCKRTHVVIPPNLTGAEPALVPDQAQERGGEAPAWRRRTDATGYARGKFSADPPRRRRVTLLRRVRHGGARVVREPCDNTER